MAPPVPSKFRARLRRVGAALTLACVFLSACVLGLALHVDLPVGRRAVSRVLERVLDATFRGRFEIVAIDQLTLHSLLARQVRVRDPNGALVLSVDGLRARADILTIVTDVLFGEGKLTVNIHHARAERARVFLIPDPKTGEPSIAAAFELVPSPRPSPGPPRPVRVWLPAIEIGKGEVRGSVTGLPPFEGDVFGARGSVLVAPSGVAVDAPHFSAVVRGLLAKELRAVGSFHQRGTTHFWSNLDGHVGGLQVDSVARLDGKRLKVTFDVPHAEPAVMREFVTDWPLLEAASLHVEGEGELPALALTANAAVAQAELTASGNVRLGSAPRLELDVKGKQLDLRAVLAGAPATDLEAQTRLLVTGSESGVLVELQGSTEPSVVATFPVPGSRFQGRYDGKTVEATATLHEAGMPLSAKATVWPDGVVDATVDVPRFRLEHAPRLAALGARGAFELHGKAHFERERVDASISARFDEFSRDFLGLGSGKLDARVRGPLGDLRRLALDARLTSDTVRIGDFRSRALELGAKGELHNLSLTASARDEELSLEAKTRFAASSGTRFDDVDLVISRGALGVHASAARVDFAGGGVEVSGARLDGGAGTLTASGRYRKDLLEVEARGDGIDLDAMARMLGVARRRLSGKLNLAAELAIARDVRRGNVTLSLRDGAFGAHAGVELDVSASLDGTAISGEALARVERYGSLRSSFEVEADGSLFEKRTWQSATGRLDLGLERLELAPLLARLPEAWEVEELGGALIGQLSVIRSEPGSVPGLSFLFATERLTIARKTADPERPLRMRGIELQLGGSLDGTSGVAEASARLVDAHGVLVSGSARSELDLTHALDDPRRILAGITERPLAVTLVVDGRSLDELPEFARPSGVSGVLRAEASLRGTIAAPVLAAKASLAGLSFAEDDGGEPFDLCGRMQYDPSENRVGLGLELYVPNPARGACRGQRVALGNAAGTVDLAAIERGERGFWGDAQVALEGLPVARVGVFAKAGMAGRVNGRLALSGTTDPPQISGELGLVDGQIRGVPIGTGELSLRTDGRDARVSVKLVRGDGALEGEARVGVNFRGVLPSIDGSRPVFATATFENLDAGVLQPALSGVLSDLGGRLDGRLTAALSPRDPERPTAGFTGEVQGKLSMLNGTFQIAGLGMRLTGVKFQAETRRVGTRTYVSIRELSGASRSKHPNVAASADLYLDGVTLEGGRANANLRKVPLMIEGVSQATLTGSANLELVRKGDVMRVAIRLPELTAELPRSAGGDVIAVEGHPDIQIVQPIAEPRVVQGGESLGWELLVTLGKKVRVVRGDLQIPLAGQTTIALGERVKVGGDLELKPGGRVQLLGKSFVIETGEVHFDTGDASNPHIRVLASWRAPDSTTIWVEVRGTLREATLRLESDPVRSQADIQALLLGGGSGTEEDGGSSSIGYGTDFVGELLGETPFRRLELRMAAETSVDDRSYATYTAAVPLSDTLWLEGSYMNVNAGDVGEQESAVSTTVEWRFRQNWSLRTEIGTIGAGLDLLYQYRY